MDSYENISKKKLNPSIHIGNYEEETKSRIYDSPHEWSNSELTGSESISNSDSDNESNSEDSPFPIFTSKLDETDFISTFNDYIRVASGIIPEYLDRFIQDI